MGYARLPSVALLLAMAAAALAGQKHYRLPSVDLKQQVLWGSECEAPDGYGLAFGGEDQQADDGRPHTRIKTGGAWKAIGADLRRGNPLQALHDRLWSLRNSQKTAAARARAIYFRGLPAADEQKLVKAHLELLQSDIVKLLGSMAEEMAKPHAEAEYEEGQIGFALSFVRSAAEKLKPVADGLAAGVSPEAIEAMAAAQIDLEKAAEALDAEPPPRALSPLAYDAASRLFVLFGGDHLDYLTNDTWVFDPAKTRWMQRHPKSAPPPRANHQLKAADGKLTLSGGHDYTSSTDYCGGQYKDVADGDWVYVVAANAWSGTGKPEPPDARVYRTGVYLPGFFLRGPKPDAAANEALLTALPANTWTLMKPPFRPRLNRDWGTAILDPDRDLILRWSGGHSAHGGSDVLHYYLSTNRWELPFPVEFPLGQLYSNTSYPSGFNFNLRPWVTGHTYQNYGYAPVAKKMLFTGEETHCFVYDPDLADWVGRAPKPKGMVYNSCFYTLTLTATPKGLVCWTERGRIFRFDAAASDWAELQVEGKLPGASVDFSTMVYDSKRDRLLIVRTGYGKGYDGQVYAVDLKGLAVAALSPANMAATGAVRFGLDRGCYDPGNDLFLLATLLPPDASGFQRTPAYDCARNRWVSLKLAYEVGGHRKEPLTPRGHSCGLMHDPKRKLIWGVDTDSTPYVLRLDAPRAEPADLE